MSWKQLILPKLRWAFGKIRKWNSALLIVVEELPRTTFELSLPLWMPNPHGHPVDEWANLFFTHGCNFTQELAKTEHKHWLKINIFSYYICLHANHNRTSKVPHIAAMNKFYSCVSKAMLSFRLNEKKEIQSQSDEHKWEVMPRMCLWQFLHFECFNTWEKENEKMTFPRLHWVNISGTWSPRKQRTSHSITGAMLVWKKAFITLTCFWPRHI